MSPLLSALSVVFLAELGDKTQLVALGFGARYRLTWVLAGMALAYVATNLLSVVFGALLGAALPDDVVRLVGGALFIAFAMWTLRDTDDASSPPTDADEQSAGASRLRVVGSVATAMFVAEFGDKTMLATATLASTQDPVLVWVGATMGIFLAGAVGAVAGRAIGARLSRRLVRLGSAGLFAVFGVALIASTLT